MEYIPATRQDIIKHMVEIVPERIYWIAADIVQYAGYLRLSHNLQYIKPTTKYPVPKREILKQKRDRSTEGQDENQRELNMSPSKSRRVSSRARVPVVGSKPVSVVYTDKVFFYKPLANDFGPLDLATTFRYIHFIDGLSDADNIIIHVTDHRRANLCANSACLIGIYAVIRFGLTGSAVRQRFISLPTGSLLPFRDASRFPKNTFPLDVGDICESVSYAIEHKWIDWNSFDVEETESLQHIANGDLNWIVENRFMAFAGPSSDCTDEDGLEVLPPSHYVEIFKKMGVSDVVRLNVAKYEPQAFEAHGLRHHDLFFEDGSCPPKYIVDNFFSRMGKTQGAVAVHCKAGLGRSVSMIGLAVMKEYKVPAKVFIAWARLARPGSVIGPQQHFLVEMEKVFKIGNSHIDKIDDKTLVGLNQVRLHGEAGQGGRLRKQKLENETK